jgi:hypothetical protein
MAFTDTRTDWATHDKYWREHTRAARISIPLTTTIFTAPHIGSASMPAIAITVSSGATSNTT